MNLSAVFLTGLLAGGISCTAVQGGLLAGLMARQSESSAKPPLCCGDAPGEPNTAVPANRSWRGGLVNDCAPVGGFLFGKLLSHAMLGAALAALGSLVQLSVHFRMIVQLCAGIFVIVLGLAQLGAPVFRNIAIRPPISWQRFLHGRARSRSAIAPFLLGFSTVLVPCGVTLSIEALALTAGSAWAGAAIMAVFVAGTSPLFAILGYLVRKAITVWRGRLAILTGLAIVAMGLYTLNGALELAGSPLAASRMTVAIGITPADNNGNLPESSISDGQQRVLIEATNTSYKPGKTKIKAGLPTTLIIRAKKLTGCTKTFVIPARNKYWVLPDNGDLKIQLGVLKPGKLRFICAMGMYRGELTIVE